MDDMIFLLIILFLLLGISIYIGFSIVRWKSFKAKFKEIKLGMSYEQVISIIGLPEGSKTSENIQTCVWSVRYTRNWHFTRVVTFKNEKVLSIKKRFYPSYTELDG